MITSLRLLDFKNFADETLRVGPFTVIVGANASGKSNIRDAFRLLHGVGRNYTLAEIIGGKYVGGDRIWTPIRGAPHEVARAKSTVVAFEVRLELSGKSATYMTILRTELLGAKGFRIGHEHLVVRDEYMYSVDYQTSGVTLKGISNDLSGVIRHDHPILTQCGRLLSNTSAEENTASVIEAFANMRFLDLVPDRMRQPSIPGQNVLGDNGENLPTVLQALCADPEKREVLAQWTRELTPMDVTDLEFPDGPDGKVHLMLRERSGREISAQSASDGTLRFLAMLAALLGPDPARLYFFEEIDNGIHPSRLHLLIDLIERQTAKGQTQVIATTHSPDLLTMIGDTTFENTSVVCRLEHTDDAIIRPVADLPNARKLRTDQGLGRLLAGGWMEDALAFTEGNEDSGMDSG